MPAYFHTDRFASRAATSGDAGNFAGGEWSGELPYFTHAWDHLKMGNP